MIATEKNKSALKQSWLSPKANSRKKGVAGRGVFAASPIQKDELIAMWGGKIYHSSEVTGLPEMLSHFMIQIDKDLFLAPASENDVDDAEFFNHSCDPNCGMRGQAGLVAMRDIESGEELTFDYAMSDGYDQDFQCDCGAASCRRQIRGNDHELPDIRRRYDGYFSVWKERAFRNAPEDLERFGATGAWGLATALDLQGCNPESIRSAEKIRRYTVELCDRIGVKRFGDPVIVHFGEDERVAGYSLVQLIETSLVSGHFANLTDRAYLDIFSCAYYDPSEVARFSAEFFEARSHTIKTTLRF